MTSLGKATAAPVDFDLHGDTVQLYPLRMRDWGRIEQWMRTSIINATIESLRDADFTESEKREIIRLGQQEAERLCLTTCFFGGAAQIIPGETPEQFRERLTASDAMQNRAAFLDTFEGMLRVVHLSIRDVPGRHGKPKFSLDGLDEKIGSDYESLSKMYEIIVPLSLPDIDVVKKVEEKAEEAQSNSDNPEKKVRTAEQTPS